MNEKGTSTPATLPAKDGLLPCPWCGVAPKLGVPGGAPGVWCMNESCLARPMCANYPTAEEARFAWNTRVTSTLRAPEVTDAEAHRFMDWLLDAFGCSYTKKQGEAIRRALADFLSNRTPPTGQPLPSEETER